MKLPAIILSVIALALIAQEETSFAQGQKGSTKPSGVCVILKRMGPADEITSHEFAFGMRGKQYQYVEGDFPKGVKFHGRLTDNDVRQIMDKGGKIQLLEPKYSPDDLASARRSCATPGAASLTPADLDASESAQGDAKPAVPAPASADHPSAPSAASASEELAKISVSSTPDGADIYADGAFVGNAPATLKLTPGKHTVKVTMAGFKDWERDVTTEAGSEARLLASLEKSN
jgi:hypothetical protein